MWSVPYIVWSGQCAIFILQCAVCIVHCAFCIVQCVAFIVQCAMWSALCSVFSVQCAVCSVRCAVCSVQRAVRSSVQRAVCWCTQIGSNYPAKILDHLSRSWYFCVCPETSKKSGQLKYFIKCSQELRSWYLVRPLSGQVPFRCRFSKLIWTGHLQRQPGQVLANLEMTRYHLWKWPLFLMANVTLKPSSISAVNSHSFSSLLNVSTHNLKRPI